jgi:hypothetical protein
MCRYHVVYESRPRSIIVTLGGHLFRIPKVVLTTVLTKQSHKVIYHTTKFSLFTTWSREKYIATTKTLAQYTSIQQNQINKIVEEHQDIPTAPTGVPPHCPVKPIYDKSLHVLHDSSSPIKSSHTPTDHAARLVKQIQPLQQHIHNILQQAKQDNICSKASSSPRCRFRKIFSISHGNLTQWGHYFLRGKD